MADNILTIFSIFVSLFVFYCLEIIILIICYSVTAIHDGVNACNDDLHTMSLTLVQDLVVPNFDEASLAPNPWSWTQCSNDEVTGHITNPALR